MTGTATATAPTGDGPGAWPGPDEARPARRGARQHGDGTVPATTAGPDEPGDGSPGEPEDPQAPAPPLAEVTVPLATLQRRAERAGDSRLLGPLDPALARDLAAAAARSPASRWEITIVDEHGYAIGHGTARPARGASPPAAAASRPARSPRAARPGQHHRHRDLPAPTGSTGGPAALRRTATGRLAAHPRQTGNLDTHPARRPAADRPARRRAHPRLRPPVPGQLLPARRPAAPPGPGPRPHLHLAALLPPRPRRPTLSTRSPTTRAGRPRVQRRAPAPAAATRSSKCPGWTVTQPKPGWHIWTTPTGRSYTTGTLAVHRLT